MTNIGKSLVGLIFLLAVLGFLIFLPAGTVNYHQVWIYLLAFAVSVILITLYLFKNGPRLLERRLKTGATAEKETTQKIIQVLANVFFCLVFII